MNKILYIILSSLIIAFFVSCDKVEEPFIEGNSFSGVYDSDLPIRKILLEDFTGFGCVNCPEANEEIHKLQERYGGHVVPIAIHAGWFANPITQDDPDYTTDVGLELGGNGSTVQGYFGIQSQPIGVINRMDSDTDDDNNPDLFEYEEWSNKIVDILTVNKFADIEMAIENTYNPETKELSIIVTAEAVNSLEANLSLSVYLIENKVIGKQKDGSAIIEDYEHNHMLRAGVNGTWGDAIITSGSFRKGEDVEEFYSLTLNENWNAANCEVVAFMYNTDTKEIFQAEIAAVIEN